MVLRPIASRTRPHRRGTSWWGHQFFGPDLLRRQVSNGAERRTGTGHVPLTHRRLLVGCSRRFYHSVTNWRHLRQPEIQNLGMSTLGHKDVRRLNVAVDDAFGVSSVERI